MKVDDPEVLDAIGSSPLGRLPREVVAELTNRAVLRDIPAGATTHRDGDPPFAELVTHGLIRAYLMAPSGRTVTARYCRKGALMGVATLFSESRPRAHGTTTALVNSRIVAFHTDTLRTLVERDIRVTRALLHETSERVMEFIEELDRSSFASLRQRVIRHLLDLASDQQRGPTLVARISQEELAGAAGTVREIVVRILHDLRDEGLVRTTYGGVELLDAARLDAETYVPLR